MQRSDRTPEFLAAQQARFDARQAAFDLRQAQFARRQAQLQRAPIAVIAMTQQQGEHVETLANALAETNRPLDETNRRLDATITSLEKFISLSGGSAH